MEEYQDATICSACEGLCCQKLPGATQPEDLGGVTLGKLLKLLRSGLWAIDWWDGDPREGKYRLQRAEFLRPAIKGYEGLVFHGSWGGECVFLTNTGCKLSFEKRPISCRALEPVKGSHCIDHSPGEGSNGKHKSAKAWLPYRHLLKKAGGKILQEHGA